MNIKSDNNINELTEKNKYSFCISIISQLIEEIELEFDADKNKNKILNFLFSLLRTEIKLLQDLFCIQNKQLYNIVQFKEIKSIFDNGKENLKKIIKEVLSCSKPKLEKKLSKNNNNYNNIINSDNTHTILENKNIVNKKKYNTKTFNKNINYYLMQNVERKLGKENFMTTIPKSIDINNNNNSNSISSFHIFKQNKKKIKKNISNIKKNSKTNKITKHKPKTKSEISDIKSENNFENTLENKNFSNSNDFNINTTSNNNINTNPQKIIVNQINRVSTSQNMNKTKNYIISNLTPEAPYIEENPVRKVKNIIINAKNVSSLNIDVINQYYTNKKNNKNQLKNCNSLSSLSKGKINVPNNKNDNKENKTYGDSFYPKDKDEQKINIKKNFSKDRKCNEILIDGMKNIKMKLNIGKNKKIKKAKSIGDLYYIKEIINNKKF